MARATLFSLSLALGAAASGAVRTMLAAHPSVARHSALAAGSLGDQIESAFARVPGPEDERALARRKIQDNASSTYIGEILAERDSSVARWPEGRTAPLPVWIQPRTNIADFNKIYAEQVRQ